MISRIIPFLLKRKLPQKMSGNELEKVAKVAKIAKIAEVAKDVAEARKGEEETSSETPVAQEEGTKKKKKNGALKSIIGLYSWEES